MTKENMVFKQTSKTLTPDCVKLNCLARYLLPYLSGFLLQGDRLKQVKTIETARWDLV